MRVDLLARVGVCVTAAALLAACGRTGELTTAGSESEGSSGLMTSTGEPGTSGAPTTGPSTTTGTPTTGMSATGTSDPTTGGSTTSGTTGAPDPVCGDGVVDPGEQCDDGPNNGPGKACNAMCQANACGDGDVGPDEQCDDGADNGDTNSCKLDCTNNVCGDGKVGPGEGCDDGNQVDDDECSNTCVPASCGDGVVAPTEQCDDGNADNTDACTAACTNAACSDGFVQPGVGEECDAGVDNADNAACTTQCKDNVCGDGAVFNGPGGAEACDDGVENGPGKTCNAMCQLNVCGDGDKGPSEECDDGNLVDGDGCSAACVLEACGNKIVDPGEGCDDGQDGDQDNGCTDICQPPKCGDGFQQASLMEQCDQGGANSNAGACTLMCKSAFCGDGLIRAGVEQCDDGQGNNGPGKACNAMCKANVCGDGDKGPSEACDDGNQSNDDACTNVCKLATCGDGFKQPGEECDAGPNNSNTGACTLACKLPKCGDGFTQLGAGEECDDANKSKAAWNLRQRREFHAVAPGCLRVAEGVGVGQGGHGLRRELALLEVDVVRHRRRHPGVARERLERVGADAHVGKQGQHAVADPVRSEHGQARALLCAAHPHSEGALEGEVPLPSRDTMVAKLTVRDEHELTAGTVSAQSLDEPGGQRDDPILPLGRVLQVPLAHAARDLHRALAEVDVFPHQPGAFADSQRPVREQQVQNAVLLVLRRGDEALEFLAGVDLDLGLSLLRPGELGQVVPLRQLALALRVAQGDADRLADLSRVVVGQLALLSHAGAKPRQGLLVDRVESKGPQDLADVNPCSPVIELRAVLELRDVA